LSNAIRKDPSRFDFIAVFPQARENTFWVGEMIEQAVKALDQTGPSSRRIGVVSI
jgi:hypothetical protein